jgi:two-component system phosphate regulon sensor histidine kinase PhoR
VLVGGVAAVALGLVLSIRHNDLAAASVRGMGAAAVGVALLVASRRAIAARVAASAAATLLLVVLVLSLGLSVVLQNTVQDQAVAAVDSRARIESARLQDLRLETIRNARLLQAYLIQGRDPSPQRDFASLVQAAGRGEAVPALAELIQKASDDEFSGLPVAYASASGVRVPTRSLSDADLKAIVGSDVFMEAIRDGSERGTITVIVNRTFVTAAVAVRTEREGVIGAVVAAFPLDQTYLLHRAQDDSALSLALLAPVGALPVTVGTQPGAATRAQLVRDAFDRRTGALRVTDGRFIAAQPVKASDGSTALVLVASTPTTSVDQARLKLFRIFFLIALGGAVLALLFATVVGERIGGSVRRLTIAAGTVQSGDLGVRTEIRSDDEIGVLSAAFDSMVSSIQASNAALAQAADDESRLRNRLEAVVAGMGEALVAVDESGAISEFNTAAEELIEISAGAARGEPLTKVLRVEAENGTDLTARLAEPGGRRWSSLATLTTKAGAIPVAVTSGALRDAEGLSAGSVIVIRDLRGEQEVERMKREFLSRVGHELRTPLTPIIGYARILASRDMPRAKVRELNGEILQLANRQFRIVEMLEFFAALEAGRDVLQVAPVKIVALIDEIVDGRVAAATNHAITRRVRRGTPDVLADAHWLSRAIDELVDNAIKFSPAGGPVQVTAEAVEDRGRRVVRVTVADRGTGMSPGQVEAAFDEFSQHDESDTRAFGGLGLGLPLARRVVERLGGRVEYETKVGKGSRVSLFLPVLPTSEVREARGDSRGGRRRPPAE